MTPAVWIVAGVACGMAISWAGFATLGRRIVTREKADAFNAGSREGVLFGMRVKAERIGLLARLQRSVLDAEDPDGAKGAYLDDAACERFKVGQPEVWRLMNSTFLWRFLSEEGASALIASLEKRKKVTEGNVLAAVRAGESA